MPYKLRNLHNMPHELFTLILMGGVASAAAIIGLDLYLAWKGKSKAKHPANSGARVRGRHDRGSKRRQKS